MYVCLDVCNNVLCRPLTICTMAQHSTRAPPHPQHYDDVDVFVCQTSGTKRWLVYGPDAAGEAGHLTTKSSPDFQAKSLPKPLLQVELSPGDVLYMPRGTVHQAQAQEQGSSHLTLSAYQRWNYGSLAGTLLRCLMDNMPLGLSSTEQCVLPRELRVGLPVGWLYESGLQVCCTEQWL